MHRAVAAIIAKEQSISVDLFSPSFRRESGVAPEFSYPARRAAVDSGKRPRLRDGNCFARAKHPCEATGGKYSAHPSDYRQT
jgi:hypothetical protein